MIINERIIKSWSIIGPRATFGLAALELVKEHQNMMISHVMFLLQQVLIDLEKHMHQTIWI